MFYVEQHAAKEFHVEHSDQAGESYLALVTFTILVPAIGLLHFDRQLLLQHQTPHWISCEMFAAVAHLLPGWYSHLNHVHKDCAAPRRCV